MRRTFDIKIDGQPYLFPEGQSGLQLGATVVEPAQKGQVASIVVESFHGGVGHDTPTGPFQFSDVSGTSDADVYTPGVFAIDGTATVMDTETLDTPMFYRPSFIFHPFNGELYVQTGRHLFRITTVLTDIGGASTLAADASPNRLRYTGGSFRYGPYAILCVEDIADNNASIYTSTATTTWLQNRSSYGYVQLTSSPTPSLVTTYPMSFGVTTRSRSYWVRHNTWESTTDLYWAPYVTATTLAAAPVNGPISFEGTPKVSWMMDAGNAVLIAFEDGSVRGFDESGFLGVVQAPISTLSSLTAAGTHPRAYDAHYGRRAAQYKDAYLLRSEDGLWAVNPQTLVTRQFDLNDLRATNLETLRGEVDAVAAWGDAAFVAKAVHSGASRRTGYSLWRVQAHADGSFGVYRQGSSGTTGDFISDAVVVQPHTDPGATRVNPVLLYLIVNTTDNTVALVKRDLRLKTPVANLSTTAPTTALIETQILSGDGPAQNMTKLFLGVRGYLEVTEAAGSTLTFPSVTIDGKAVSLAAVDEQGPFYRTFTTSGNENISNRLGRSIKLQLQLNKASATTLQNAPKLIMPLSIDYVWVPDTDDRVTIKVQVVNNALGRAGGVWQSSTKDSSDALLALRQQVVRVEFPDGSTTLGANRWDVLVEDVFIDQAASEEEPVSEAYIATLTCRRLQ